MISKKVNSVEDAFIGLTDNMTLMVGGFGLAVYPKTP